MKQTFIIFSLLILSAAGLRAQNPLLKNGLRFRLNESGSLYVKATFLNQTWIRFNQNNPGTTVSGYPESETFDVGLRRTRLQLFGQISERVFFYTQFGMNNFTYRSERKSGDFFHDALAEYTLSDKKLRIGAGLSSWTGYLRFSSPSAGSIMGLDAPLYQQATNDVSDQFVRKLSVYAKGKIGKLDYRLVLAKPMDIAQAGSAKGTLSENVSSFSDRPANVQWNGYFSYEFFDAESNTSPYHTGTYHGKKKVFNLGAGFVIQKDAMQLLSGQDTVFSDLGLFGVDLFYDAPLNEIGSALHVYLAFSDLDFGKNYVRNNGVMNPANGVQNGSFNGAGNAFPFEGTGNVYFAQAGYKFKDNLLGSRGTLMPFAMLQIGDYQAFDEKMMVWSSGVNWLINGHKSKISAEWQSRPVFRSEAGKITSDERKGMFTLQYQVGI